MTRKAVAAGVFLVLLATAFFFVRKSPPLPGAGTLSVTSSPDSDLQASKPAPSPINGGSNTEPSPVIAKDGVQAKAQLLDQILASRNDNDPRMDTELRVLDQATKDLFRKKYRSMAAEKRNERGTVVFLIGRNITDENDLSFICEVLREPPCFSLADCQGTPASASKEDFHAESGESITLAYPQMVALSMLERFLQTSPRRDLAEAAVRALRCGQDSRVEAVIERANAMLSSASDK
ncbi:MAG: hypothetical protein A2X94_02540 [Bdellovibrionales bacterium GWB1_55_8]|nr:MAG: hypothetical protein A2X94_02540 [Bdellovibrionales bacterium GWB1_55_8]